MLLLRYTLLDPPLPSIPCRVSHDTAGPGLTNYQLCWRLPNPPARLGGDSANNRNATVAPRGGEGRYFLDRLYVLRSTYEVLTKYVRSTYEVRTKYLRSTYVLRTYVLYIENYISILLTICDAILFSNE